MAALRIDPAKKKEIRQYADLVIYRFRAIMEEDADSDEEDLYVSSDSVDLTSIQDRVSQDAANAIGSTPNQENCQNAGPGANNAADAFMHSLRDELRTDGQGSTSRNQGTALGP
ncbi:hypothetical protein PCANC_17493 [Puccinia coronata f. sp. avenae]|uniref:Uncharacterized protein n=1 Tax=Puccinia coronata f. sp. avenae TaxID=200324 RepID=A0A2N5SS66_9BASI|nr:hypothetical protein PCANC_17493 [Puccinia coronata f. sp. avenae]